MSDCAASVGRRFLCKSCVERAIEFGLLCDKPLQLCFGLCALATRQDASCEFGAKFLDLVVDVEHVPLLCLKTRGAHRAGVGWVEDRESDRRSRRVGEPKCAAFWGDRSSSTRPAPLNWNGVIRRGLRATETAVRAHELLKRGDLPDARVVHAVHKDVRTVR